MTTLTQVPTSDLILRVSGGSRDGELIPVSTPKCFLGMEPTNEAISQNPQCVIFRGRQGAVIRSYAEQVLVNDGASSLHWLQEGDKIKFPNSMSVEVMQLGELKESASSKKADLPKTVDLPKVVESTVAPQKLDVVENSTPAVAPVGDSRLVVLESELRSIQMQNEQSLTRFDNLDERLSTLTEKMTLLINLSDNGSGVQVSQASDVSAPGTERIASPVNDSDLVETTAAESQVEEKIINPVVSESLVSAPQTEPSQVPEVDVPAAEANTWVAPSPVAPVPVVEEATVAAVPPVDQTVESEEVIQSPLTPSPLDELNRIDQAIEESVSGYYSHTDDSDEQILTFDAESSDAPEESVAVSEAVVVEEPVQPSRPAENGSLIAAALASATTEAAPVLDQSAVEADADAAAEAKAIADAAAEKESRLLEMERIFGGATADPETTPAESVDSVATIQTADDQPSQTFEDPTHGQNAEVVSSADTTLPNDSSVGDDLQTADLNQVGVESESESTESTESTESDDLESRLSPMARQLLEEVKADQKLEQLNASESAELGMSASAPESTEPEPATEPEENLSVAELLARMKEDGKWDGVESEDTTVEPTQEPVQSTVEPVQESVQPMDSEVESTEGAGEGDVEDYMSQLLSRMRGETPETIAAKPKIEKKKKEAEKKKIEKAKIEATEAPLKPEDFKPKQKAKKLESLDAMRELANSNARTNVKVSETQNRKELAYVQAGIGVGGLLMSLYYFLVSSKAIGDMPFMVGFVCLAAAGFCGYRFYSTMKDSRNLAALVKKTEEIA